MNRAFRMVTLAGLGLIGAGAASAQDALCAGQPTGRWAGGSAEGSDVATAAVPFDMSTFVPVDARAVTNFTLSAPASVRFEAKGTFAGDPIGWLYDEAGNEIANSDDGGADLAVRGEVDLVPGNYCFAVGNVDSGLLPVEIRVGRTDQEALTVAASEAPLASGETCAQISNQMEASLAPGWNSSIPVSSDVAVWFDLAEPQMLTIEAEGNNNDPLLNLQNEAGETLEQNDDHTGLNARIDRLSPLEPGRYCVVVSTYEEDGSSVDVSIRTLDRAEIERARIESGQISPMAGSDIPVAELGTLAGRIAYEMTIEEAYGWVAFEVDQSSLAMIDALALDGSDPQIALFDDAGREIARNDDRGDGDYSSRVVESLAPGRYLLGLSSVNAASEMTRIIIDQYVRVR